MSKAFARILIHKPDDLTTVHSRSTTDCHDSIGLKGAELFEALFCRLKRRIGRDIPEARVNNSQLIKGIFDGLGKSTLVEELVGDDEDALFIENIFELFERFGHAAFLEVHLIGSFEPKHIFAALGHRFNVEQVHHPYVSAY